MRNRTTLLLLLMISPMALSQSQPKHLQEIDLRSLGASLLFDQSYDSAVVRPFPANLLLNPKRASSPEASPLTQFVSKNRASAGVAASNTNEINIEKLDREKSEKIVTDSTAQDLVIAPTEAQSESLLPTSEAPPIKDIVQALPATLASAPAAFSIDNVLTRQTNIAVFDGEAFFEGHMQAVPQAELHWIHPHSPLKSVSIEQGLHRVEFKDLISARFVVIAKGFLPAVGYATKNYTTPVVLFPESRLGPILKSLNIGLNNDFIFLLGKILSQRILPKQGIAFEEHSNSRSKNFYSLGSIGLFHPKASASGSQGEFAMSKLPRSLQYLLPSEHSPSATLDLPEEQHKDWAASIIDFSNLGSVISTTLVEPVPTLEQKIVVLDSLSLETPDVRIFATVGGQRGIVTANSNGELFFKNLFRRNSVDLIEIKAQGYWTNWLSSPAIADSLPSVVTLVGAQTLRSFQETLDLENLNTLVLGFLRPEIFTRSAHIEVLGSDGKPAPEGHRIAFFNQRGDLDLRLQTSHRFAQSFLIANLPDGEWHVVIRDANSRDIRSIQAIRVQNQTITQIQF